MSRAVDVRRAIPWALCAVALILFAVSGVLRWLLRDEAVTGDVPWLVGTIGALGFVGIPVVGALIASRLPDNPYGWVWCGLGLAYAVADLARPLARAAGWPLWVAWLQIGWAFVVYIGLFVLVFLLFPTGRLPSPGWRGFARAVVVLCLLLLFVVPFSHDVNDPTTAGPWAPQGTAGRYLDRVTTAAVLVLFGLVLVGMLSLVLRFRSAGPVERRQLTWFAYATLVNAVVVVVDSALGLLPPTPLGAAVSAAGFALLPIAVGIAVLRYRLFEIDRIVSRTVSYGLLSAALVGLYLLVVALLRPLLAPLTGNSALAVAGSTLAVAAAFNPVRRRLQEAVDRRFDRARYDAARAVDAFAARLRDQVDLDEMEAGLRGTLAATVAPVRIGIWLQGRSQPGRSGS